VVVTDKIRRLTPLECFRLQGFPDDFKKVVSDTQLYKQAGNSITVNVIQKVIQRIYE
jgi:DNA (cytosine-5)-methyltransferase 1